MPLLIVLAIRISIRVKLALEATFNLLRDAEVRRALPWRYIKTLPRRNAWIAIVTASLTITVVAVLVAFVSPSQTVGSDSAFIAVFVSWLGVNSSWVRTKYRNRKIRR